VLATDQGEAAEVEIDCRSDKQQGAGDGDQVGSCLS